MPYLDRDVLMRASTVSERRTGIANRDRKGRMSFSIAATLLADPAARTALAANGRTVIRRMQGATERNANLIDEFLSKRLVQSL